jgi:hypothetical protein
LKTSPSKATTRIPRSKLPFLFNPEGIDHRVHREHRGEKKVRLHFYKNPMSNVRRIKKDLPLQTSNTIGPFKLDFAAEKKGGRPSRPCGNWSTCSHPAHWNRGARQRTQAGRLFPFSKIQKQAAFGINLFVFNPSVLSVSFDSLRSLLRSCLRQSISLWSVVVNNSHSA